MSKAPNLKRPTKKPGSVYFEAAKIGITDITAVKRIADLDASSIWKVWDYRKYGLKVDEARKKVLWLKRLDKVRYSTKESLPANPIPRFLELKRDIANVRSSHEYFLFRISQYHISEKPSYLQSFIRHLPVDRVIITEFKEDVTWGRYRYPVKRNQYYISRLLKINFTDKIPASEIISQKMSGINFSILMDFFTEKSFRHDLRGNWQKLVVTELLGKEYWYLYKIQHPELLRK